MSDTDKRIISVRFDGGTFHYYISQGEKLVKIAMDEGFHSALKRQQALADEVAESQKRLRPYDPQN